MINVEKIATYGWEAAVRGMRNPLASHEKSDSEFLEVRWDDPNKCGAYIGTKDWRLMRQLVASGPDHSKFMRMLFVTMDVTAPLYFWKEADQYKVGTTTDSYSTMHTIHKKEFELDDFSHEHLINISEAVMAEICRVLNTWRNLYLETRNKEDWWQMIQLLPSSYNQKRTWSLNYAVLRNIYHARNNHKLDEWRRFCEIVKSELPYSELIWMTKEELFQEPLVEF